MTKLDHPKITTAKKPKESNYDGPVPLEVIGRRPIVTTPKTTEREAKERMQTYQKDLEEKLVFVVSEEFQKIISKEQHLKKIEDLIHELRSSPHKSACLADGNELLKRAKALLKKHRSLRPSQPSKDLGLSPLTTNNHQTRTIKRGSRRAQ